MVYIENEYSNGKELTNCFVELIRKEKKSEKDSQRKKKRDCFIGRYVLDLLKYNSNGNYSWVLTFETTLSSWFNGTFLHTLTCRAIHLRMNYISFDILCVCLCECKYRKKIVSFHFYLIQIQLQNQCVEIRGFMCTFVSDTEKKYGIKEELTDESIKMTCE